MSNSIMRKIAKFIVEKHIIIMLLFVVLVIYSALSISKVRVNEDITALLPPKTATRRGLTIMENEFTAFASANVMVSNITYEKAAELAENLREIENVATVSFDDSSEHYASSSALFTVAFSAESEDERAIDALEQIKDSLSDYEVSVSTTVGQDYVKQIAGEITQVLILALIVIAAVLLFTSKSYFEVIILFIVFAVAAVLNMGTNYWLREISSVTNSIAIILQLALAIDYAIIFCHRFQDEYDRQRNVKSALTDSLAYSIIEISSSSLTTISGLVALMLMQFRLGYDLGLVLTKGIICSMLTVFLLMPGLIMLFHKALLKTRHKNLVPNITGWGRLLSKKIPVFLIIFAFLLPAAIVFSAKCEYTFSDSETDRITLSEQDRIKAHIYNTFDETNMIAVLVPVGDYAKEKALISEVNGLPGIRSALGLASIEIEEGRVLTDPYTARAASELLGVDIETAKLLYALYGYEHDSFQPILGDSDAFAVPLIDMLEFLFEAKDRGMITLDDDKEQMLESMRGTLDDALVQLRGEHYSRIVFNAAVPVEGEESVALIENIESAARKLYSENGKTELSEDAIIVIGDITSAKDLEDSFRMDNNRVSFLTIAFVFVVLLFTFRSLGAAVLLILVIQSSIWLNFSFPYITGTNLFFVTYLIVSAIQMGATIDYAIVLYNRFQLQKTGLCAETGDGNCR